MKEKETPEELVLKVLMKASLKQEDWEEIQKERNVERYVVDTKIKNDRKTLRHFRNKKESFRIS